MEANLASASARESTCATDRFTASLAATCLKHSLRLLGALKRIEVPSLDHTFMGKALLQMLRVLGPQRGLQRMTRNLRTSNNYSDTKLSQMGPTAWELLINRVAFPHYYRGLIERGLEYSGAKGVRVEVVAHTPNDVAVLIVAWS